jgi:hypothetical protein
MGFESFQVELLGGRAKYLEADAAIRALPHGRPDPDGGLMPGSLYYLRDDGRHVIEIELSDAPVRFSCRFTLCHPASVVRAFLDFVGDLLGRLGMEARICDDVRPEHAGSLPPEEVAKFSALTASYIHARRKEWVAAFGSETLAATTNEVHQRIILPRCQPGIKQQTQPASCMEGGDHDQPARH